MSPNIISIVTPTYNRAHTLPRLFTSLVAQQQLGFEWVVVDDGSTDGTRALVEAWQADALFPVRYLHQLNGGKHVALNTASQAAVCDWVFIVDSDDCLTPDAVAFICTQLELHNDAGYSGLCFRRGNLEGEIIGRPLGNVQQATQAMHPTEAGKFYAGDLAYVFAKKHLLAHPFPVFPEERFVPELFIWNKIGDQAPVLYHHHRVLYLTEYLAEGYSANFKSNLKRNPKGFGIYYRDQFRRERALIPLLKCAVRAVQCWFYETTRSH